MPAIIAGGLLSNLLCLVVLTRSSLRGVTYTYLSGLAAADLGVILCAIPLAARRGHSSHAELAATGTFMASSTFIVVCLAVDRYVSVCVPTKLRGPRTRRNARLAVVACYVAAAVVSCPLLLPDTMCTDEIAWFVYLWASEAVVRIAPAIVLVVLNALIVRKFLSLSGNRRRFRAASDKFRTRHLLDSAPTTGLRNRSYHEERHLVALLSSLVILFLVTTTTSVTLSLFGLRAAAGDVELCKFAFNLCVYLVFSKEFRREFLYVVKGCPAHQQANEEEAPSQNGSPVPHSPDNVQAIACT
ncbi:probable G-protein coupled receptor B0563.6 isoform X2 [Periplaneta americana]